MTWRKLAYADEVGGYSQEAAISSVLTLTTSYQDVAGMSVTLPTAGTYLVVATLYFQGTVAASSSIVLLGILTDSADVAESGSIIWQIPSPGPLVGDQLTLTFQWRVVTTTANEVFKMRAKKIGSTGTQVVGTDGSRMVAFSIPGQGLDGFTTHILTFSSENDSPAVDDILDGFPNGINVGESGEHGTYTALRGKATVDDANKGTGTNTIVIEADDNPAFSSATTLFTLSINALGEVDDTTLDNTWADGDIFIRARWTAVATAPKRTRVEFLFKEQGEHF